MPGPDFESPETSGSPDGFAKTGAAYGGGLLGGFEKLESDGVSERWRYHPIDDGPLLDENGNACPSWIVARPILNTADIADHNFVVVADSPGAAPQARFSYGPSDGHHPDGSKLVSLTGVPGDETDRDDRSAWKSWNNPFSGVRIEPIPASDAAVLAAGQSLDRYLGTPSHPGPVDYALAPEFKPGHPNSNSAAAGVVNQAVSRNPPPLDRAYLDPYPGSLSPGWYRPIPGWKP
jgi:hypothetical protein